MAVSHPGSFVKSRIGLKAKKMRNKTETTDLQVNPLIDFADRWQLDGDYIRCKHCQRPQQISWLHHEFPHRAWCHNIGKDMNPWKTLAGLITAETAKARVPS